MFIGEEYTYEGARRRERYGALRVIFGCLVRWRGRVLYPSGSETKKTMIPQYLHAIYRQLAGCHNNNNSDTDPLYKAMVRATESSQEVAESRVRCTVLKSLSKNKIGTSCVKSLAGGE